MFGWQTRLSSWIRVSVCQSAGSEVSHYLSSRKKQMRASVFDVLFFYRTRGSLSFVPIVKFQKLLVLEKRYHRLGSHSLTRPRQSQGFPPCHWRYVVEGRGQGRDA